MKKFLIVILLVITLALPMIACENDNYVEDGSENETITYSSMDKLLPKLKAENKNYVVNGTAYMTGTDSNFHRISEINYEINNTVSYALCKNTNLHMDNKVVKREYLCDLSNSVYRYRVAVNSGSWKSEERKIPTLFSNLLTELIYAKMDENLFIKKGEKYILEEPLTIAPKWADFINQINCMEITLGENKANVVFEGKGKIEGVNINGTFKLEVAFDTSTLTMFNQE